jgi:hypothetical protein
MPPVFPGFEGLPFRGIVPDRKELDPEKLQPQQGVRAHVEILDMAVEEDRKRMEDIYTTVANGHAIISAEEREYDPDKKNWRVFLRWADLYMYNPQKGIQNGSTG